MLHRRQRVCVFDDFIRCLKALLNVAVLHMINAAYIAADLKVKFLSVDTGGSIISLRMEHRGVELDSLEDIEHCRKLFIINFDETHRFFGNLARLTSDQCYDFANMAHTLGSHDRLIIDDWPEIGIQSMEIIPCYDGDHSGKLFCFRPIN